MRGPLALEKPAMIPDAGRSRSRSPLDLPRQVMRRAGLVALVVLLLALSLGLARMGDDIDDEVDAAMALASVMAGLGQLAQHDDASALASLQALQAGHPLRHLALQVQGADGRLLLGPAPELPDAPPLGWLLALHRQVWSQPDTRHGAWEVPRAEGGAWTVSLTASHASERREAMRGLLDTLGLLLACVAGLLLVMRWNVRQTFAPLGQLLDAIAGIEGQDTRAVRSLPAMPIRELESVAAALRHLGAALDSAEAQRQRLSQQVLTLQDDERVRLAHELHDEFGQRLTALRVDAAWLGRQVADQPALKAVVVGMSLQCEQVQLDIRALLARLQPFGPLADGASRGESLARGVALLRALVASWQAGGRDRTARCRLALDWVDAAGMAQPWPEGDAAQALCLPRVLWLTLYRISQEALTNVARHAQAGQAVLALRCTGGQQPGDALCIDWQAWDDGIGLPDPAAALPRGNGLAGLQQRVWAQGGEWRASAWQPGRPRPGLRLEARFSSRLLSQD